MFSPYIHYWQGVKLTWLMSIFTSQKSLEIFDTNSADKIQSQNYKEVKVPCLMPIRAKNLFVSLNGFKQLCLSIFFSNLNIFLTI